MFKSHASRATYYKATGKRALRGTLPRSPLCLFGVFSAFMKTRAQKGLNHGGIGCLGTSGTNYLRWARGSSIAQVDAPHGSLQSRSGNSQN